MSIRTIFLWFGIILLVMMAMPICPTEETAEKLPEWQPGPDTKEFKDIGEVVAYAKPAVVFIRHRNSLGDEYTGTGILVHKDGLVITCAHMVKEEMIANPKVSDKIWVRLYDGNVCEAERRIVLPEIDVALLKIDIHEYPYLDCESSLPKLADEIVVIGYPMGDTLGKELSVTKGIISSIRFSDTAYQLDAAVNEGNSGGPVINKNGDVVGVLSFKVKDAEGMAFAISSRLFPLNPSQDGYVPMEKGTGKSAELAYYYVKHSHRLAHINHNSMPPICRAAFTGDIEQTKKLIMDRVNIESKDADGNTPLILAADLKSDAPEADSTYRERKASIVKLILDTGANINATNNNGDTAITNASAHDFNECVVMLVERGAKVNVYPRISVFTPLTWAANYGRTDTVKLLLKNGADPNYRNKLLGRTTLGTLRFWHEKGIEPDPKRKEIERLLIEAGAVE